ncbi:predicted protein, partial [Nematostella vectensis]
VFQGNKDGTSVVVNWFEDELVLRFFRILPKTSHRGISLRMELYGCSVCRNSSVGVSAMGIIPEYRFTASSYKDAYRPPYGRAQGARCWCAASNDDNEFLQIDLGTPHTVCAVGTQGCPGTTSWSRSYRLSFSMTGILYDFYKDQCGNNQSGTFDGNNDRTSVNIHEVKFTARHIRIYPLTWNTGIALRVGLYGCSTCGMSPVGVEDMGLLPDHRITASSFYDSRFLPKNGRLNSKTAWATKGVDQDDYLQIDLGNPVVLCGVATQGGGPDYNEFVKRYLLETSMNGYKWVAYKTQDDRQVRERHTLFPANQDKHRTSYNGLPVPIIAKFIRIFPKDHYVHKTMKVELYGVAAGQFIPTYCRMCVTLPSISDNQLTAFSNLNNQTRASAGRLYGPSAWCAKEQERSQWFQADLLKVRAVIGIATQSAASPRTWAVETYRLKMGVTQDKWTYTEVRL